MAGAALSFGGMKAYAYYQVESRINAAKRLQASGDYKGSTDEISGWENKALTGGEGTEIRKIESDNQKFAGFKTSFDSAVSVENSTSTAKASVSSTLQKALKMLQSIDSTYPDYKDVQAEMAKIQNALVTALQKEAEDSAQEAARSRAAAAAAQAERAQAEQNAAQAADSAQAQANAARTQQVLIGFRNELTTGYNSYIQAYNLYGSAIQYSNNGDSVIALSQSSSAESVLGSAYSAVSDLNTRYTNMPSAYYDANNDMLYAIGYLSKALDLLVQSEGTSLDYSSTINEDKDDAAYYASLVSQFLSSAAN